MLLKSIAAAIIAAIIFPALSIVICVALIATHQQVPVELGNTQSVKVIALKPAPLRATGTATSSRNDHAARPGPR